MSCSLGALLSVLLLGGNALDPGSEELAPLLRNAVHNLLHP
jgi:hypothetical protein